MLDVRAVNIKTYIKKGDRMRFTNAVLKKEVFHVKHSCGRTVALLVNYDNEKIILLDYNKEVSECKCGELLDAYELYVDHVSDRDKVV